MKFHATVKGKQTSISVDDVLIDYLGAWYLEESPKGRTNAKAHYEACKKAIKKLCERGDLPSKNISQFIQGEIVKLIAAPNLYSIIEARGPRYVPPKRSAGNSSLLPELTPEQLAAAAERKRAKAQLAEDKKKLKARLDMKRASRLAASLTPAAPSKRATSPVLPPASSKSR